MINDPSVILTRTENGQKYAQSIRLDHICVTPKIRSFSIVQ